MKHEVKEGQHFGELIAKKLVDTECLEEFPDRSNRVWICTCSCGGHILVRAKDLARNIVHHCNQCSSSLYTEPAIQDLTGKTFGNLYVIQRMPFEAEYYFGGFWKPNYAVKCTCGKKFVINHHSLVSGFKTCCSKCEKEKKYVS